MATPTLSRPGPRPVPPAPPAAVSPPAARIALLGAMALAAVAILWAGRGVSFFYDEWNFVLDRGGVSASVFLEPHTEHLSLVPIVIYKALFVVAGLDHYWAYRLVLVAVHLACAGVVFAIARRAVGEWGA